MVSYVLNIACRSFRNFKSYFIIHFFFGNMYCKTHTRVLLQGGSRRKNEYFRINIGEEFNVFNSLLHYSQTDNV